MSSPLVTIEKETPCVEAIMIMRKKETERIPVIDKGNIIQNVYIDVACLVTCPLEYWVRLARRLYTPSNINVNIHIANINLVEKEVIHIWIDTLGKWIIRRRSRKWE